MEPTEFIVMDILQREHPEIPAEIGKFDDFRSLSRYISETVQDTTKVTILLPTKQWNFINRKTVSKNK